VPGTAPGRNDGQKWVNPLCQLPNGTTPTRRGLHFRIFIRLLAPSTKQIPTAPAIEHCQNENCWAGLGNFEIGTVLALSDVRLQQAISEREP